MTICNMSIEGGARVGYVNPDETTFDYLRGRQFRARGQRLRRGRGVVAQHGVRPGSRLRRRGRDRRGGDPADRDVGHQPRAVCLRRRTRCRVARRRSAGGAAGRLGGARVHGASRRRSRSRARGSTSRSSVRAPTRACPICARPRGWCEGHHVAPHVRALAVPGSQSVAAGGGKGRARPCLHRGGLRLARCRLLDVPGDESGSARRPRNLRVVLEPQLQGAAGQSHRPHPAHEPGDGGGGRRGRAKSSTSAEVAQQWPLRRSSSITGTRVAAARRQHRHRPDHPGAVPAIGVVRGARGSPVRRRPHRRRRPSRQARIRWSNPAYAGSVDSAGQRQLRLRLVARARAAGHPPAGAFRRSSANRSRRSSSATPLRSACRASAHRTPTSSG